MFTHKLQKNRVMLLLGLKENTIRDRLPIFNYERVLVQVRMDSIQFDSISLNVDVNFEF
jgi:hypothetical protein